MMLNILEIDEITEKRAKDRTLRKAYISRKRDTQKQRRYNYRHRKKTRENSSLKFRLMNFAIRKLLMTFEKIVPCNGCVEG